MVIVIIILVGEIVIVGEIVMLVGVWVGVIVFHKFTTHLPSLLMIFFLLPLSTRSFFFRKCFHENERERARQGAARKEEHERESGLKKLVQIK
jgi:uncharacterized membrane protein YfcA